MSVLFNIKLDKTLEVKPLNDQGLNEPSDEVLIGRFLNGSRISYELIVQRYKKRIFEFIYFQIKQHSHDAEDLTQEVFLELYKKADHYRNESKFSTYLFSIAKNIVLNYFRSSSRRFSFSQLFNKEKTPEAPCPQQELICEASQQQLVDAINSLTPDERQIIYLSDRENFSYVQISNILNIKVGTVRSRLNTARKKVTKFLREYNHEM